MTEFSPYDDPDFGYDPESQIDTQFLLAETIMSALRLGEELKKENGVQPASVQYQLALAAENIGSPTLHLPRDIDPLLDDNQINLVIITYIFQYLAERPYLELRIEQEDTVFATMSKPGVDENAPFSGNVIYNNKDYQLDISPDDVADLLDQIVLPSFDNVPVGDPQNPSQARAIIDRLTETQHADIVESHRFELAIPEAGTSRKVRYNVQVHKINENSQEIEIETVLEDSVGFDAYTQEPVQSYRSIIATFAFDTGKEMNEDSFMQSVHFIAINSGEDMPKTLPSDEANLMVLKQDIEKILTYVKDETEEIQKPDGFF